MLTTILVIVGVGAVVYFGYQKFGSKNTTTTTTKAVTGSGRSRAASGVTAEPKAAKPKK